MARMADPTTKPPLPDPLPADPLLLVQSWMAEAIESFRNATAMTVATVDLDGRPSARMMICRGFDASAGWFAFYTDRESRKGHALARNPWAALVFHWDAVERQIRVEGPVTRVPDADSDAYWQSRPPDARIAAAASDQSRPIDSRAALLARLHVMAQQSSAGEIPRPERWGGYRVWAERVELWVGQPSRVHDRALWTRSLEPRGTEFTGGPWSATRLQP
jgi:pyridoxamine 5'-phosphate oxidase